MIVNYPYVGPSIGVKTFDHILQEQKAAYDTEQRRKAMETVANGACLVTELDHCGLVQRSRVTSKALVTPSNTFRAFAERGSYRAAAACNIPVSYPAQVQRARHQEEEEIEEDDSLADEIRKLQKMVVALPGALAQSLKQGRKEQPREQPGEEPEEKAGLYDNFLYVPHGVQWIDGKAYSMMTRSDYPSVAGLVKSGLAEYHYRTSKNGFRKVAEVDQLPTSPQTGRPSQLRKLALAKAGLTQKSGHMPTRREDCESIIGDPEMCDLLEAKTRQQQGDPKSAALRASGLIL